MSSLPGSAGMFQLNLMQVLLLEVLMLWVPVDNNCSHIWKRVFSESHKLQLLQFYWLLFWVNSWELAKKIFFSNIFKSHLTIWESAHLCWIKEFNWLALKLYIYKIKWNIGSCSLHVLFSNTKYCTFSLSTVKIIQESLEIMMVIHV